ncbi:MAG: hypothetical protein H6673_13490 [Anaerolineales bacterium]|nr:hypothetical protein [Anaerolineales bacterium]
MVLPEGHEALMRQAFESSALPTEVDPAWLILGNVRTDFPTVQADHRQSIWHLLKLVSDGFSCKRGNHPIHAMRCRGQVVADAYSQMRQRVLDMMYKGCDAKLDWETRALSFGSALHTLQDSYCTAHAARIDNSDPHSPIINMHTYPSQQHPLSTQKDVVWQDPQQTAFKPDAAAAITATIAALKIFNAQKTDQIEPFLAHYLAFREDIAHVYTPR